MGPAHGGANEAVIKMLNEIESIDNIKKFIDKAKDKMIVLGLWDLAIEFIKTMTQEQSVAKNSRKST